MLSASLFQSVASNFNSYWGYSPAYHARLSTEAVWSALPFVAFYLAAHITFTVVHHKRSFVR
jgi:hypothetical protein